MSFVKDIDQVKEATAINTSIKIEALQPYLDDAHNLFILPLFPRALSYSMFYYMTKEHDATLDDVNYDHEEQQMDYNQKKVLVYWKLIHLVRKAESLYALWLSADELSVYISGAGIQVIQSDTHRPAPQYQIMNMKETFLTRAHNQVDLCLDLLYNNLDSFYETTEGFYDSNTLIRNAKEFQVYSDIHSSRRVFLSLLPIIRNIEKRYIIPTLTYEVFQNLYNMSKNQEPAGGVDWDLFHLVQPALVHLSMARALAEINIDLLDWGIFNNANNTFNNVQNKAQANITRIALMQEANQRDGEAELKAVQEFLDNTASADTFPAYFNSSRYVGPATAVKRGEFLNDASKSMFVV